MLYVLAVLLPPLAILLAGRPFQAILSLILMVTLIAWPVASVWALVVVANHYSDKRTDRLVRELTKKGRR